MIIYDANVFKAIDYDILYNLINGNVNYLTDDTALELFKAKKIYSFNESFVKTMDLVLQDDVGLKDSFSLILSKIPFGYMAEIAKNTKSVEFIKSAPLSCVVYHLWLTFTLSPSGITFMTRTLNSLLTDHLKQGLIDEKNNKIENLRNKLRLSEIKNASNYYNHNNVKLEKIIRTWAKRNTDISNHKFKYTDAKIIVASLCLLLQHKCNVEIITADYDLIDLQNNLFLSIYDQYSVKKVLERHCKVINLETDTVRNIFIPHKEIIQEHENTLNLIKNSKNNIYHTVRFFDRQIKNYDLFTQVIPDFIYNFILEYTGNFFCFEIDNSKSIFHRNIINYIWYMPNPGDETIRYDVWLKNNNKSGNKFPACKGYCKYEMDEMNNSKNISSFIMPEKFNSDK